MARIKIGVTERGDPSLDYSWKEKMDSVDGCIMITKNLGDHLILETKPYWDKMIFHVTCTGYGGTVLEPNIPRFEDQLEAAGRLVFLGFPKNKVVVRVDPIIPTEKGIQVARSVILMAIKKYGFRRFRISLIDMYPHVRDRFAGRGLPLPYGNGFSPSASQLHDVDKMLYDIKENYKVVFESCAEDKLKEATATGCVGWKEFDLLGLPDEELLITGYQRSGCLCCSAKTELLSVKQQCPYRCLYCYWKIG